MREVLDKALDNYGLKETVGKKHNPVIVKMFSDIGHGWVKNDELAWCAMIVNWWLKETGYEYTGKLNARSFLEIGEPVKIPEKGNLVIFWRINKHGPFGHVGLFIRETNNLIYVLGGNQNNKVCIKAYPKSQLLEYRKLKKRI